jgi:hypothetical protein
VCSFTLLSCGGFCDSLQSSRFLKFARLIVVILFTSIPQAKKEIYHPLFKSPFGLRRTREEITRIGYYFRKHSKNVLVTRLLWLPNVVATKPLD